MKTLSKLNLCVDKTEKGEGSTPSPATEKGKILNVSASEDSGSKNDPKSQKIVKKKDSSYMLATVKEEASVSTSTIMENADIDDRLSDEANSNFNQVSENEQSKETQSHGKLGEESGITESDLGSDFNMACHSELEGCSELKNVHVCTAEKEPCAPLPIPSIRNIMVQQKDSFEMEEVGKTLLRPFQRVSWGKKVPKMALKWKVANGLRLEKNPNFVFPGFLFCVSQTKK